ncbi:response regulator transcription factor [Mesorhizobium sp. RP14(2022)]|uniref:Response regulator transcription factor n=1 Tax=Mesorhizobium liriopis TaxID=2953882 RepID=A0ABT1C441_9HYPH|nr:response regulator transcription factor [Mesorhizobium liriopis]MCO6048980.1 response regulator transcription factor [Mesorhizobium liriopis]
MTDKTRVLVVDDDSEIRQLLGRYLEGQGFATALAGDRRECEAKIAQFAPDLVVLDVMLPDGSGLDICRDIKNRTPGLAVILLTALKEDVDRIIGLELGADDYLGKPFNPRELSARIKAVLRRGGPTPETAEQPLSVSGAIFRFETYRMDTVTRAVTDAQGAEIELTGTEFDLLRIFLERPGRVLSRETLLDLLHGRASVDPFDRTIDVSMSRLRRRFGDGGVFRLFKTVRNGGYQFAAHVEREERTP